jgi:hypothetical protein
VVYRAVETVRGQGANDCRHECRKAVAVLGAA